MSKQAVTTLQNAQTVVIKFGSNIIKDATPEWFLALAQDIQYLKSQDKNVIIVTSGAIALGRQKMNANGSNHIPTKQTFAAIGQPTLIHKYNIALEQCDMVAGQILLTNSDARISKNRQHATDLLQNILTTHAIPIINENDAISIEEITFGDNDGLAAHVAEMIKADVLILFSTIDGFYNDDPNTNPNAQIIPVIHAITDEHKTAASENTSSAGTGGGKSKLQAALTCVKHNTSMIITNGESLHCLRNIFQNAGKTGTIFLAPSNQNTAPPIALNEVNGTASPS